MSCHYDYQCLIFNDWAPDGVFRLMKHERKDTVTQTVYILQNQSIDDERGKLMFGRAVKIDS